ncbi:MAG TPA: hypothetical protein DEQ09_06855 [Bacteroidales bacterium]|nr:hypothetical protein [Bacteroidales bacterium]
MKKLLILLTTLIIVFFGTLLLFPSLYYSSSFGQKIILRFEGDKAARFYFNPKSGSTDTLYMKGVIYSGTLEDFNYVIKKHPEIKTLTMAEVPGSVDDETNLAVSLLIRAHGINTYIPENGWVASGGTDMFLAGYKRERHLNTRIGVHSWGGEKLKATEYPRNHEVHRKYLNYYRDIGISKDFYWFTLEAAPAEKTHWLSVQEIDKFNVITETIFDKMLINQKTLSSDEYRGRKTGENQKAQALISESFNNTGLLTFNNSYKQEFNFFNEEEQKTYCATNIIGYRTGSKLPDKYIVIGAHYDHLGVIQDSIYNGADDNASGTAALMMLAEYFSVFQPRHSIIFAAFDAEEMGLHGSRYFIDNPPVKTDNIILDINMDMLSYNPNNEIYVSGTYYYPQFRDLIEEIEHDDDLVVLFGHDDPNDKTIDYWMNGSDNAPFFRKGVPNITFSEEDHVYYHQPGDDYRNMHHVFYKGVAGFILDVIKEVDMGMPQTEERDKQ